MPNPQRKESTYLVCVFLSLAGLGQISFPSGKWPQALKARVNPLPPDTIMAFLIVFLEAWASSSPKTARKHPALSTVSDKWACRLCSNQWVAWLPRFYIVRSTSWGWFHYCSSLIRTFLKGSHVPSHFLGAQNKLRNTSVSHCTVPRDILIQPAPQLCSLIPYSGAASLSMIINSALLIPIYHKHTLGLFPCLHVTLYVFCVEGDHMHTCDRQ